LKDRFDPEKMISRRLNQSLENIYIRTDRFQGKGSINYRNGDKIRTVIGCRRPVERTQKQTSDGDDGNLIVRCAYGQNSACAK
jgi:hypothetical protein